MVSMADEFKIDWAKAIEEAAIDYADAYVEMQCDADNDHQREHRQALRDLRETIKRGLECAAAPQPAAQPEHSGADLIEALRICATQSIGKDWTPEQAVEFIKQHARSAIAAHEAKRGADAIRTIGTAQPEAQPELTDEEIVLLARTAEGIFDDLALAYQTDSILGFARAIIAAHEAKRGAA